MHFPTDSQPLSYDTVIIRTCIVCYVFFFFFLHTHTLRTFYLCARVRIFFGRTPRKLFLVESARRLYQIYTRARSVLKKFQFIFYYTMTFLFLYFFLPLLTRPGFMRAFHVFFRIFFFFCRFRVFGSRPRSARQRSGGPETVGQEQDRKTRRRRRGRDRRQDREPGKWPTDVLAGGGSRGHR